MLAPLEPIELLFERLHEPSDDSPILYRERAYLVDALQSDTDLEEHLEAELSRIRRDWRHRDASQFVQLSLYDHRFQGDQPSFPPVATLSWKDWQGRSEIWVRGVRRSTLPPGIPLDSIPPVPRPGRPTAVERRAIAGARTSAPPDIPDLPVFEPTEEELVAMSEPSAESSAGLIDGAGRDAFDDRGDVFDDPGDTFDAGRDTFDERRDTFDAGRDTFDERRDSFEASRAENDARNDDEPFDATLVSATDSAAPESASFDTPASSEHIAGGASDVAPAADDEASGAGEASDGDAAPDSGPGWQSPDRSGEFPIPVQDDVPAAPSSQRVLASEELVGALFERLHEIAFVATLGAGADCLLAALSETIPCDGALIHVLDVEAEEFVVMRALGPDPVEVVARRTRGPDTPYSECLRRKATLELSQSDIARQRGTWQTLGVLPRHVIVSPVHRHNQAMGVIELCRTTSKGPFSAAQISALEYACEQFAEFAAERPMELARASLYPPTPP